MYVCVPEVRAGPESFRMSGRQLDVEMVIIQSVPLSNIRIQLLKIKIQKKKEKWNEGTIQSFI